MQYVKEIDVLYQAGYRMRYSQHVLNPTQRKVKGKVNVDLYSDAFSRNLTVLPAHLAFIR